MLLGECLNLYNHVIVLIFTVYLPVIDECLVDCYYLSGLHYNRLFLIYSKVRRVDLPVKNKNNANNWFVGPIRFPDDRLSVAPELSSFHLFRGICVLKKILFLRTMC